jgi:hypothetical protein
LQNRAWVVLNITKSLNVENRVRFPQGAIPEGTLDPGRTFSFRPQMAAPTKERAI